MPAPKPNQGYSVAFTNTLLRELYCQGEPFLPSYTLLASMPHVVHGPLIFGVVLFMGCRDA